MKIKMLARTEVIDLPDEYRNTEQHPADADELAEIAGRLCYKSWDRPNPKTATNEGYIANIIKQQHFSVLEHASATFHISGVSRSLTHELVRHRHFSFSQVSQRYVDESEGDFVYSDIDEGLDNAISDAVYAARKAYTTAVESMTAGGLGRKQARQAARYLLPNAVATEIIVSGNLRSWREFVFKRLSPGADAEIRELARVILGQLLSIAPNSFADLKGLLDG